MPLDFATLVNEIDIVLDEIEAQYQRVPGLILTEDDLKCVLYKKLTDLPALIAPSVTDDGIALASTVHAEVSWYDENGRLTLRPDITIIEPENLNITGYHRRFPIQRNNPNLLPDYDYSSKVSKDFEFGGNAIIFELKFIRGVFGTHPGMVKKIKADYDKIMRLLEIQDDEYSVFCYQVIFNKTDVRCDAFNEFLNEYGTGRRHKIIYKTGNFLLPHKKRYLLK